MELLKPLGFPKWWAKVTFGKPQGHLRMKTGCQKNNLVIRGLELSVPPSRDGRLAGDWVPSLMANDLINFGDIMKPPEKPQRKGSGSFQVGGGAGKTWTLLHLPYASLPSGHSWVISFYDKLVIEQVKCFSGFGELVSKLIKPKEESWKPLIYSWLVRSTGENLDLLLASEIGGWGVHSCRTKALTCGIWWCNLQGESTRSELNCRTHRGCQRIAWWCGGKSQRGIGIRIMVTAYTLVQRFNLHKLTL